MGTIPTRVSDHPGGSIQAVDLDTGSVETVYTECDGRHLIAPNDLVFDDEGGFYFTDHGVGADTPESPGVLYAKADGSFITPLAFGTEEANGIGLAPDGRHLYVAADHQRQAARVGGGGAGRDRQQRRAPMARTAGVSCTRRPMGSCSTPSRWTTRAGSTWRPS